MKKKSNKKCTTGYVGVNTVFYHQLKKVRTKKLQIHPYEKLCGGPKGLCIKGYEVNWDSKLSVSFNEIKYKDINKYNHGETLNNGKIIIRYVSHIRSISPFINEIIGNHHIYGNNKVFKIISCDLTMPQIFHLDSVWSLYEGSILNT